MFFKLRATECEKLNNSGDYFLQTNSVLHFSRVKCRTTSYALGLDRRKVVFMKCLGFHKDAQGVLVILEVLLHLHQQEGKLLENEERNRVQSI